MTTSCRVPITRKKKKKKKTDCLNIKNDLIKRDFDYKSDD